MKHFPLIRTIYLYLFSLTGLALLVVGGVRFVDMGLKIFIFTKAEEEQRIFYKEPSFAPYPLQRAEDVEKGEDFSEEEKAAIRQWLSDYENWKKERAKIDPITAQRHRDASLNLALNLIGLPLYLYHWRTIKRETQNKEE